MKGDLYLYYKGLSSIKNQFLKKSGLQFTGPSGMDNEGVPGLPYLYLVKSFFTGTQHQKAIFQIL